MAKLSLPSLPLEKIAALTRTQRIAICAGTALFLGVAFFYFIYMPKSSEVTKLKKDYGDIQVQMAKAKHDAKNLEKYQKEYKEAQGELKLALQLLPDKKEIPGLLEAISKSGMRSGLEFILFQPGKEVLKDFYAEIPVSIEVIGGYHNLAIFFNKVAGLPRIVNISRLSIKSAKASKEAVVTLSAKCVATTYQFVEVPKAGAAKGKSRRGKKGK